MSHVVARIVADYLDSVTTGVNALAALSDFPRLDSDEAPPGVTVYDETRDAWVMRGLSPDAEDELAAIDFPAVVVTVQDINWTGDTVVPPNNIIADGSATACVQLYLQSADTVDGVTDAMYLTRAIHSALVGLDNATDTVRTLAYTQVKKSTAMQQVKMKAERGDLVVASAFLVTYPVSETTPVTF